MARISDHKMVFFNITNTSGEHKEFENINPEISKYNFNNGDHAKLRATLKEANWDQVLGDAQNIEKTNENFTRALIDAAKKANIPLYRQRRPIELEGTIIKLNSKPVALEAQIKKQFIQTFHK